MPVWRIASRCALVGSAPRLGIVAAAKLDHQLLGGFVLDRLELLEHDLAGGFEIVRGQVGAAEDVGIDRQGGGQVFGDRYAAVARVRVGDRFAAFDAEVVQVEDQPAIVAGTGAAVDHFADEATQPGRGRADHGRSRPARGS